jgi:toxin-antitoxin system PIN domain toxin
MEVIDTNVLIYAADVGSEHHAACRSRVEGWRKSSTPAFVTLGICYEFMTVSTHSQISRHPLSARTALAFIRALLDSPGIELLAPTHRHLDVLTATIDELPDFRGALFHDLRIAVIMREHGVSRICTRDVHFHRFPFLTVIDPTEAARHDA